MLLLPLPTMTSDEEGWMEDEEEGDEELEDELKGKEEKRDVRVKMGLE